MRYVCRHFADLYRPKSLFKSHSQEMSQRVEFRLVFLFRHTYFRLGEIVYKTGPMRAIYWKTYSNDYAIK